MGTHLLHAELTGPRRAPTWSRWLYRIAVGARGRVARISAWIGLPSAIDSGWIWQRESHRAQSADAIDDGGADAVDAMLLRRLRHGDEDAFRELVTHYGPTVRAYALGMLGSPEDADDAAQECFLRVYRRIVAFRGESTLLSWMLRICRNHCLDRLRASRPDTVELSEDVVDGSSTADQAIRHVDRARLLVAVSRLPDLQQQVVVLRELRGLSYEETADAMGVPVGTVRSRLHAARSALQVALGSERV